MRLDVFVAVVILVLVACYGCTPNFECRREAFTRNAHPNLGLGTIIADAISPPKPHPPLADMLNACEGLK